MKGFWQEAGLIATFQAWAEKNFQHKVHKGKL
jgi:hypothetical protein